MNVLGLRIPLDPAALPFLVPSLLLMIVGLLLGWPLLWIPMLLLSIAFAGFFRDPERAIPTEPGAVVSPADGRVDAIAVNDDPKLGPVGGPRITIFLSVLNVHVNRAPYAGEVTAIEYRPGQFLNALDPESTMRNEANRIRMRCVAGEMTVTQIAGIIARRIVCRVRPGQRLEHGQRIGLIRFGSRTQLCLPPGSRVVVEVGQNVRGASTIVGYLPGESA